jgi:histidine ammonia-lyase
MSSPVVVDGESLTLADVEQVARRGASVELDEDALSGVEASRAHVEELVEAGETVYGVTTGIGELKDVAIDRSESRTLQENLLASHACGVGPPLPRDVVRAMMLLRANALAVGVSGVRVRVLEVLVEALEADVVPLVPSRGSVGSSGDLVPLAHVARALTGDGEVLDPDGEGRDAGEALAEAGIEPLQLEPKEGLALVNGTQMQAAVAALLVQDARRAVATACVAGATSVEGLRASRWPFDRRLTAVRPHEGAKRVAASLEALLDESGIMLSHADCDEVQDPYSFRCMPQVHGAVLDAVQHLAEVVEVEINSATDNPLVFPDDELVVSGGNFHGEPLGQPLAYVGSALAKLAAASERRTSHLLQGEDVNLPAFLTTGGGVNSGLMMPQYVAASLVNENKALAHPVVADTVPTSGNQEDVNAMGATQALHARKVLENLHTVLAVEVLTAAQAIDFHAPIEPGVGVKAAYDRGREEVEPLDGDRALREDIQALRDLVVGGDLVEAAEGVAGPMLDEENGRSGGD